MNEAVYSLLSLSALLPQPCTVVAGWACWRCHCHCLQGGALGRGMGAAGCGPPPVGAAMVSSNIKTAQRWTMEEHNLLLRVSCSPLVDTAGPGGALCS